MKRKMTRLALGAKCGSWVREVRWLTPAEAAPGRRHPYPRRIGQEPAAAELIWDPALLLGNRFVEVEQDTGSGPSASAVCGIARRFAGDFMRARGQPSVTLSFAEFVALGSASRSACSRRNAYVSRWRSVAPPSRRTRLPSACGGFHEQGLVQRGECLQRRIGAGAAHAGHFAVRRIEGLQYRVRHGAETERVQAAAIPVGVLRLPPVLGSVAGWRLKQETPAPADIRWGRRLSD